MKSCPTCNSTYSDDTLVFCLMDGSVLTESRPAAETLRVTARDTNPPATETLRSDSPADAQSTIHAAPPNVPSLGGQRDEVRSRARGKRNIRPSALVVFALVAVGVMGAVWLSSTLFVNKNSSWSSPPPPPSPRPTVATASLTVEEGVDRPGSDYRNFDLPDTNFESCREACAKDANCAAYTFVKAGIQSVSARCWLKSAVPPGGPSSCCVSGVKTR